jgi:hypothetical protein
VAKKYTSFSGCFNGHSNPPVQFDAHLLMEDILGYITSHWMPLMGKCLHCIPLAATKIINFFTQKGGCKAVLPS